MKFLQREDVRDERGHRLSRGKVVTFVKKITGDEKKECAEFLNIKGHGVRTYWVPSSSVSKTPEVEAPLMQEDKL
jgi:hypothetical protein